MTKLLNKMLAEDNNIILPIQEIGETPEEPWSRETFLSNSQFLELLFTRRLIILRLPCIGAAHINTEFIKLVNFFKQWMAL
jgi:hypothetical protein